MDLLNQINDHHQFPVFIAELSANHNGSLERALEIIQAAKEAGADMIKFQTYTADSLTIDCDLPAFTIQAKDSPWNGLNYYQLYQKAYTPFEWHQELFDYARKIGIEPFSTPFCFDSVNLLDSLGTNFYKIASFESVHLELLKKVGSKERPVIISNGMASLEEISIAVSTLKDAGCPQVIVLKCCSAYPAPLEEMNLSTMLGLRKELGVEVGLSDHSPGHTVAVIATALGARVFEKHLTLKSSDGGFDAAFSMEPDEFAMMIKECRQVFEAKTRPEDCPQADQVLGKIVYGPGGSGEKSSLAYRRSIFVISDINAGEALSESNIAVIRPGNGLHPHEWSKVLGKQAKTSLKRGHALSWEDIE